ncbi:erythromycin esterase family protein [Pontibacter akesuensis]|uniref:Erythromycin esterase homolog n=1 Tax=Pontibacter akesuensis TaxID=388950 RepID=A0A1I7K969_9BACT|nr:erythromycin esterase family protein [Pontibacter akesuensis]SFU93974.1 Erythromycin esterase homolog [Pontibacter akesuensis]
MKTPYACQQAGKQLLFVLALLLANHIAQSQGSRAVTQDIQQHFIPLSGSPEILPPAFLQKLEGKRLVGLGEATHGTAEFEQMFSLLARSLVLERGFNVVILAEANFYDTRALNDYVVYGKGNAETAVRHIRHSPTLLVDDEEARKLAEWIRAHNRTKVVEDRVWMLGIDAMALGGGAYNALKLCRERNIPLPPATHQYLSELASLSADMYENYARTLPLDTALARLAPLLRAVQHQKYKPDLNEEQQWLLQSVMTLEKAISFLYDHHVKHEWSKQQFRDEAMLANIKWVLERRPAAKMIIYGHNGHMGKEVGYQFFNGYTHLGGLLHSTYGKDFYAICTEAHAGSFWAGKDNPTSSIAQNKKKIGLAIGQAVDAPAGLLELNATPALTAYFNSPLYMTFGNLTGTNYSPASTVNLASAFDALLFVRESTPKVPVKPKSALKRFSFNLVMQPAQLAQLAEKESISVSVQSGHTPLGTSLSGEGAYVSLMFLDSQNQIVGYQATWLTADMKLHEQHYPLPPGSARMMLTVTGSNVAELHLADLQVNGIKIDLSKMKYYGEGYDTSIAAGRIVLKERG